MGHRIAAQFVSGMVVCRLDSMITRGMAILIVERLGLRWNAEVAKVKALYLAVFCYDRLHPHNE